MDNIFIVLFPLYLLSPNTYATSGSDVVNCAGCFAQKWNWASWQCDVRCDVETSKYGQVDGFTVTPVSPTDSNRISLTNGQTFIWGNVLVNIQGGYDVNTGIFTVTIPGVYEITLTTFASNAGDTAMDVVLDRRGTISNVGKSIAGNNYRSTSMSIMYELLVGDKLYVVGVDGAIAAITGQETRNVFRAHILYKSLI